MLCVFFLMGCAGRESGKQARAEDVTIAREPITRLAFVSLQELSPAVPPSLKDSEVVDEAGVPMDSSKGSALDTIESAAGGAPQTVPETAP